MPDIAPPFDKTNTFIALCWARAQLYAAGTIGLHDAVDSLQEWAVEKHPGRRPSGKCPAGACRASERWWALYPGR